MAAPTRLLPWIAAAIVVITLTRVLWVDVAILQDLGSGPGTAADGDGGQISEDDVSMTVRRRFTPPRTPPATRGRTLPPATRTPISPRNSQTPLTEPPVPVRIRQTPPRAAGGASVEPVAVVTRTNLRGPPQEPQPDTQPQLQPQPQSDTPQQPQPNAPHDASSSSSPPPPPPPPPPPAVDAGDLPALNDIDWHKSNSYCWKHFDLGLLEEWKAAEERFCTPPTSQGTVLRCREMTDSHLPAPTAPHTMCDAHNLGMDFSVLNPARCQVHRPGYKCGGPAVFWAYNKGALLGQCEADPERFQLSRFPRDHLRDIFDSWQYTHVLPSTRADAPVTLFITREREEHANLFHATTDFINAFEALHMVGIIDAYKEGDRSGIEKVQVVLLDEQDTGPFDDVFARVFSPNYPVLRGHHFRDGSRPPEVTFPHAIFVHPGYTNFMFVELFTAGSCTKSLQLLQAFREFYLRGFNLRIQLQAPTTPVRVLFISRKPYNKFVEHFFMGRQITNEDDLVIAMQNVPNTHVALVDMAQLSYEEQLKRIVDTDILVGMHGAALTQTLFQPPWGGLIELWPKEIDMWRCFEHLAEMSGKTYRRWANQDPGMFRADEVGDYTTVNVRQFDAVFREVHSIVSRQRQAYWDSQGHPDHH